VNHPESPLNPQLNDWPSLARGLVAIGAVLAGISVAAGAFGTHGLRNILDSSALMLWRTAVDYQMHHAIGILILGLSAVVVPEERHGPLRQAAAALLLGLAVFCGSLYALALGAPRSVGLFTPLGGGLLMLGWLLWAHAVVRRRI
jgi:uncharacterized membrane protein YgdD (TMEM256/DUF423 family)